MENIKQISRNNYKSRLIHLFELVPPEQPKKKDSYNRFPIHHRKQSKADHGFYLAVCLNITFSNIKHKIIMQQGPSHNSTHRKNNFFRLYAQIKHFSSGVPCLVEFKNCPSTQNVQSVILHKPSLLNHAYQEMQQTHWLPGLVSGQGHASHGIRGGSP